jgi:hypothetical protein
MSQFNLSPEEVQVIREILESYLGDLRVEVHHTDDFDYREGLKHKEVVIKKLLQQLQPEASSS